MSKKRSDGNGLPDLPLGLAMSLAQNAEAMQYFSNLPEEKKRQVISFIQASATGAEAKHRVFTATDGLAHDNMDFLG